MVNDSPFHQITDDVADSNLALLNPGRIVRQGTTIEISQRETIGLLGNDGGRLVSLCDMPIVVPSNDTPRIQECQILIGHIICDLVERGVIDHAP